MGRILAIDYGHKKWDWLYRHITAYSHGVDYRSSGELVKYLSDYVSEGTRRFICCRFA